MRAYLLSLGLLATVGFSLGTTLEPWFQNWQGNRTQSANMLQVALGDGRRLFSNHFFLKADAYFHNGYYPSIFDRRETSGPSHMEEAMQQDGEAAESEGGFLGEPRDWIDRFGRSFFPSQHTHLGSAAPQAGATAPDGHVHGEHCNHDHDDEAKPAGPAAGGVQEILPWLRLSAELDPQRVQTYILASYWLRTKLGKDAEAEQFLRDGLRANPGDCEILLELGRLYYEHRQDRSRARNVLEMALRSLQKRPPGEPNEDLFLYAQILNLLATLERELNNPAGAIAHYKMLLEMSPHKAAIQSWIDQLQTNQAPAAVAPR